MNTDNNTENANNFFRSSFGGFNRDDVSNYITKLSRDYAEAEQNYKDHIKKLTAALDAKTEEAEKLVSERGKQPGFPDIHETEQFYNAEIDRLSKELREKDMEIKNLREQSRTAATPKIAELEIENSELKNQIQEKQTASSGEQKMYETVSAELGGIIYSAKKEAETIIKNAHAEKAGILDGIKNFVSQSKEQSRLLKSEHETMMQRHKELFEDYRIGLTAIGERIDALCKDLNQYNENL